MTDTVAIIGGGFSGAMLAARLAERGVASTLINRTADFGLGVAYSTDFDGHLLNVRSCRMSAVEDQPQDFIRWLAIHAPDHADPEGFAPRRLFGRYVVDRLTATEAAHPGLIRRMVGEARSIGTRAVTLVDGRVIPARAVVLATGNPAPKTAQASSHSVIPDPWASGALERIGSGDDIAIIGTGLTMVDMLLVLVARGWTGRATALSRRGLLPRAHLVEPAVAAEPNVDMVRGPVSRRLAAARAQSQNVGWREMMDGLRPVTADLWSAADLAGRARMVRHLRPWWDVHRHRLAPDVAKAINRLGTEGRLSIVAGRVRGIVDRSDAVVVDWTARHGSSGSPLKARWLIDCTGPGHAPERDALTAPLITQGRARLDPLRLGLDLDARGRVLDGEGRPDATLYVLGPPARAAFWETIAVPDIRKRVEDLVEALRPCEQRT